MQREPIKVWRRDGFSLRLFDTFTTDYLGKSRLAYELRDSQFSDHPREPIFQGDDFCASPMHAIDSLDTVAGLLAFLSLRPGDTDSEYFDSYTPRQLTWCAERAEYLSCLQCELEERLNARRSNSRR